MLQQELLKRTVEVLESLGIPYMLTGSTVSSLQGNPRSTHDIDVVVKMSVADAQRLADQFPSPDFYLEPEAIVDAIKHVSMFNLLDSAGGDKVDFWMFADTPFDHSCFARRYEENIGGKSAYVSRPEDTILAKLRWAQMCGGSEKQMNDCIAVYELQFPQLDQSYLDHWAAQLSVNELLTRVRDESQP